MKNICLLIVGIVLLASCKKTETLIDPQIEDSLESSNEIVTPPGFDFSMTKTVNVPIKVFGSPDHGKAAIEIYELTQQGKENIYDKGCIKPMTPVVLALEVPSRLNSVLLRGTNGEGDE